MSWPPFSRQRGSFADQPEAFPPSDNPTVRVHALRRYRYKIFYRGID